MRALFIMDPVATVIRDADTTFALMEAAAQRGHQLFFADAKDLGLHDAGEARAFARARAVTITTSVTEPPLSLGAAETLDLGRDLDVIFVRTDPPFDDRYLWMTLLLEHVRHETLIVNDPQGLRNANEKLYACRFPALMPKTCVSSNAEMITAFVREVGGQAVIKPIDGHGGASVFALKIGDPNFNAILETQTQVGTRIAMVQEYLPAVRRGDKRILLLEGEPLGAIWRVPKSDDLRSNIHVGGSVEPAMLDEEDRHIIETLAPSLRRDGLFFVGLDVIGGKLTEVNVTSPTGIQQMSRFDQIDYSARVIAWVEAKIAG